MPSTRSMQGSCNSTTAPRQPPPSTAVHQFKWVTQGLGVGFVVDGVCYRVSRAPLGLEPAGWYIAWANEEILGTSASGPEARSLCEREAEARMRVGTTATYSPPPTNAEISE